MKYGKGKGAVCSKELQATKMGYKPGKMSGIGYERMHDGKNRSM